jgi:hypothetical protein
VVVVVGGGVAPEALTSWIVTGSYKEDVRRGKRTGGGERGLNVVCIDYAGREKDI